MEHHTMEGNIQCNTDTSSDAHEDGQHNVRGNVPDKAAPVALGVPVLRLVVVVRSAVMMRLVVGEEEEEDEGGWLPRGHGDPFGGSH